MEFVDSIDGSGFVFMALQVQGLRCLCIHRGSVALLMIPGPNHMRNHLEKLTEGTFRPPCLLFFSSLDVCH